MVSIKYFLQFIILSLVFNLQWCFGQSVNFKHLTVEDGLSQSWVHAICQDTYGFIWIATEEGLNRYDGYDFKIYKHNIHEKSSLPHSTVVSLLEDGQKNLWIGTNRGLAFYDRQNDRFIQKKNWPQNIINSIAEDDLHNLWIGTNGFLYYLDVKKDSLTNYSSGNSIIVGGYLSSGNINSVFVDSRKNVWVGTDNGLNLFNKKTKSFINYYHSDKNTNSLGDNYIRAIKEDKDGRLWIGTLKGLDILVNATEAPIIGQFFHFQNTPHKDNSISTGQVLSILEDNQHNLWIGFENGGLDKLSLQSFEKENATFIHFRNNLNNQKSISSNSIHALYQDKQGIIWIGTNGKGVEIVSPEKKFDHFLNEPGNLNSLSSNLVNVFLEDGNYLWIGTEGGLDKYDRISQTFKHYIHNPADKSSISSNAIWSIYKDLKGNLWIGTYNGGLNKFNYKTERFTHYKFNNNDSTTLNSNNVFSILEDRKENFWLGTMNGGLNLFDRANGRFVHYNQRNSNIFTNYVQQIIETKLGELLLVNLLSLERFNPKTKDFYHYKILSGDSINMGGIKVLTVLEDAKQNIWIGTDAGLFLFNRKTGQMHQYQTENGLPDNFVKGILEDGKGNLWLSTNKGLVKFINAVYLPEELKFRNYTIEDGLQTNEFRQRSCYKDANGYMYFGGFKGFNRFHPDSIKDNLFIPEVVITDFLIFNKPVGIRSKGSPLLQNIALTHELTLSHAHSVFSFRFAALNYVSSPKNRYAYMMEGFDKEWNYVDNKREATYTNLNPGKYTFKVKASNNDGIWNEKGTSLTLIILPPWWQTLWFRVLIVIVLVLLINLFFYARVAAYKKRQKELTNMVHIRTQELEQTNTNLLKERTFVEVQKKQIENYANEMSLQNEGFKRINEQLREQQTQIEEQSEELRARSDNLKEVNDLLLEKQKLIQLQSDKLQETNHELYILNTTKDRFFSIIAHDLRNPFHAVTGFSEILLRDYEKLPRDKIEKYLTLINKSSVNGNVLLENLLQWSRAQTGTISFEPKILNLQEIVDDVLSFLEAQAQQKNIRIIQSIEPKLMVNADENMLKTILRNLVSNAVKFTREKGTITIEALKKSSEVQISVTDTGVGISPDNLKLLFNVETNISTRGTASESGTGLGLILCKEFVERNGGKIWVISQMNKGSEFKFTLPVMAL